jgi:hypothetical protein
VVNVHGLARFGVKGLSVEQMIVAMLEKFAVGTISMVAFDAFRPLKIRAKGSSPQRSPQRLAPAKQTN